MARRTGHLVAPAGRQRPSPGRRQCRAGAWGQRARRGGSASSPGAPARLAAGAAAGPGAAASSANPVYDTAMRQRVAAFQLGAGLKPDGLAGPTTYMLLNRALAVDEPRLARE